MGRRLRRRGLGVHVGAMVSELPQAFAAARAVQAPLIVAVDDAIERTDQSRGESLAGFGRLASELLDRPDHAAIRLAIENSVLRITRLPEDLLAVLAAVGHPRCGVNFDADNFYNAGIEPFPYAYELLHGRIFQVHVKDSRRYLPAVHGDARRVLHRAGGNVGVSSRGNGRRQLGRADRALPAGRLPRAGVARAAPPAGRDGARHGGRCGLSQAHGLGPLSPSPPRGRREHDTNRREARG